MIRRAIVGRREQHMVHLADDHLGRPSRGHRLCGQQPLRVLVLFGSLILSLTYVPAAMTFLLHGHVSEKESFLIRIAKRSYPPALSFMTTYRLPAIAVAPEKGNVPVRDVRYPNAENCSEPYWAPRPEPVEPEGGSQA